MKTRDAEPGFVRAVRRASAGDVDAFEELVARFQDMAVGYAYAILGDFQLAEDASQEAFFDAYRHLSELREPLGFPSWLRRIVFKHCDRRTRGKAPSSVPLDQIRGARERAPGPSPLDVAERHEMEERLRSALDQLPETQRNVLLLHYISGHTVAEIAAFLDILPGTVKKRLHDGRERMKSLLLDELADALRGKRPSRDSAFAQGVVEILRAARSGNASRVRELLLENPRLRHGRDVMGNTALILAVNAGHEELAALLREGGPPVGFHEAAAIGDRDRVAALLDAEPKLLDSFSEEGFTALGLAAHFGHVATTRLLLERGADPDVVFRHPVGTTALTAALFGKQIATALLLIDHGADPNLERRGEGPRAGWSPLHYAAWLGLEPVTAALIAKGADVSARDGRGRTALDIAQEGPPERGNEKKEST